MKNNRIENILKRVPLKTRLRVVNEMTFMELITELGYREDKMWTDDESAILHKLLSMAGILTTRQIEEFEEWENDGRPDEDDNDVDISNCRGCCPECGEDYDNEEEWKYNTNCAVCGHPIPDHLIIKKPE